MEANKPTTGIHNSKPSDLVQGIHYDPHSKDMTVTLHGGKSYTYPGTTAAEHNAFVSADSHGAHFATVVRKKAYRKA